MRRWGGKKRALAQVDGGRGLGGTWAWGITRDLPVIFGAEAGKFENMSRLPFLHLTGWRIQRCLLCFADITIVFWETIIKAVLTRGRSGRPISAAGDCRKLYGKTAGFACRAASDLHSS